MNQPAAHTEYLDITRNKLMIHPRDSNGQDLDALWQKQCDHIQSLEFEVTQLKKTINELRSNVRLLEEENDRQEAEITTARESINNLRRVITR